MLYVFRMVCLMASLDLKCLCRFTTLKVLTMAHWNESRDLQCLANFRYSTCVFFFVCKCLYVKCDPTWFWSDNKCVHLSLDVCTCAVSFEAVHRVCSDSLEILLKWLLLLCLQCINRLWFHCLLVDSLLGLWFALQPSCRVGMCFSVIMSLTAICQILTVCTFEDKICQWSKCQKTAHFYAGVMCYC